MVLPEKDWAKERNRRRAIGRRVDLVVDFSNLNDFIGKVDGGEGD